MKKIPGFFFLFFFAHVFWLVLRRERGGPLGRQNRHQSTFYASIRRISALKIQKNFDFGSLFKKKKKNAHVPLATFSSASSSLEDSYTNLDAGSAAGRFFVVAASAETAALFPAIFPPLSTSCLNSSSWSSCTSGWDSRICNKICEKTSKNEFF